MKTLSRLFLLSLTALALASCGSNDDNQVARSNATNPFGTTNTTISPAQSAAVQQVLSSVQCGSGQQRISQVLNYQTNQFQPSGASTLIGGNIIPGSIAGTGTQSYVGISQFNDIMIVTRVTNGANTIGFNISLHMCSFAPIIQDGRALSNFSATNGIIINENQICGTQLGSVDSAQNTMLIAQQFQQFAQQQVWTTFSRPPCN